MTSKLKLLDLLQVDREVMMTTGEAAATNGKLPKGFKYVPYEAISRDKA